MIGRRIQFLWPQTKQWYSGTVVNYDPNRKHHIEYNDEEDPDPIEVTLLGKNKVKRKFLSQEEVDFLIEEERVRD